MCVHGLLVTLSLSGKFFIVHYIRLPKLNLKELPPATVNLHQPSMTGRSLRQGHMNLASDLRTRSTDGY